jgi:DNA modification methylase
MIYQDLHIKLYNHDCRSMSEISDNSIQCVVTSPPYWGLRKYSGNQDLIWGGNNHHEHEWGEQQLIHRYDKKLSNDYGGWDRPSRNEAARTADNHSYCLKCNAWRGAFGLEPTPELYIQHSIEILREIKRVLRKDGTVFWNIGDSYSGGNGNSNRYNRGPNSIMPQNTNKLFNEVSITSNKNHPVIKPKDLCLIPFRVAIAVQEDGWWVRSVIIWSKNNPMPESVKDRPTESHEYILLLTKSAKYYWDQEAVRETYTEPLNRWGGNDVRNSSHKYIDTFENGEDNGGIGAIGKTSMLRSGALTRPDPAGRNLRSVWTFPTQGYPEAHFATFPEELPERCIKAGTPEYGCCDKCGTPYERIIESGFTKHDGQTNSKSDPRDKLNGATGRLALLRQAARENGGEYINETKTLGWQQSCKCKDSKPVPSTVLDPFAGSGTTLWVAKKLNRKANGYELSSKYCQLIIDRNKQQVII